MADGGIKSLKRPNSLLFRESQYASKNFKFSNTTEFKKTALIPRPKFLFFVKFKIDKNALESNLPGYGSASSYSNVKDGVVFQIKQIDKPKFNIDTETMHQYNKKRVVQSRIDYNPMTINFHDDIGDKVLQFWADYYSYYYGDANRDALTDWKYDVTDSEFYNGTQNGWGYQGNFTGGSANMNFLESIELIQFYGGEYTSMEFVRPLITIFDHDNNDYEEGREGTGIRISFDYEGVIYNLTPTAITSQNQDNFNFLRDYYDPDDESYISTDTKAVPFKYDPSSDIITSVQDQTTSTNREKLQNGIALTDVSFNSASVSAIAGGRSFGNISSPISNSMVKLISASGNSPSQSIIEKETGVKNTINNYGISTLPTNSDVLARSSRPRNNGIDSLKIDQAASVMSTDRTTSEQVVGVGQTVASPVNNTSEFSRSMGAASALAINEGLADTVATFTDAISHTSTAASSIVNKLPDGQYQLTDVGSTVMNALRAPSSALGIRKLTSPWENTDVIDNNDRLLNAENGDDSISI